MNQKPEKYPPVFDRIEDWPIYHLSENRAEFIKEVNEYILERLLARGKDKVRDILAKTIYMERIRIKEEPWKVDPPNELSFWRKIRKSFASIPVAENGDEEELASYIKLLNKIINRYSEEIVGTFKPKTFRFARKFLTWLFKRLLNTAAGRNHRRIWGTKYQLYERLKVEGEVDMIRSLIKKGTVVVLPTHFSNLDSIIIGYAMDSVAGLPAFSYGAGLNLYNTGYTAYFMNRLGAFRVDRRKKNPIYLEALKAVSNLSMQRGAHSLFFPGGTRSRSGALEKRLKMGLLGTTVEAQRMIYQHGRENKVYIVPLVLSYHFVLEAKYLIENHLRRTGRERYMRVKDQGISIRKIARFVWSFFSESSTIRFSFGKPLDVLGNFVDKEGRSIDKDGKEINLREFFQTEGFVTEDLQRESVYTRNLAEVIADRYLKENIVLSSHLVSYIVFKMFQDRHKDLNLYQLLRLPEEDYVFDKSLVLENLERIQKVMIDMDKRDEIKLSEIIYEPVQKLLENGIKNLGLYHSEEPLKFNKEGHIISQHFRMLYFYHNRLDSYGLDRKTTILSERIKEINA